MPRKTNTKAVAPTTIQAVKGFNQALQCQEYQFKIQTKYQHPGAVECCKSGFHACEYPLDVFSYYPPATSRYAFVELSGQISRAGSNSKIAGACVAIQAEMQISELASAAVQYILTRVRHTKRGTNTGDQSAASNTGDHSAATNTGDQSAATATGVGSVAVASGYGGKARGANGCAIVCVFRGAPYNLVHIRAAIVGTGGIKPDTFYTLNSSGEFEEVA